MKTDMTRKFFGPNGWYVAYVNSTGTHYQPSGGGSLSESEADEEVERCRMEASEEEIGQRLAKIGDSYRDR